MNIFVKKIMFFGFSLLLTQSMCAMIDPALTSRESFLLEDAFLKEMGLADEVGHFVPFEPFNSGFNISDTNRYRAYFANKAIEMHEARKVCLAVKCNKQPDKTLLTTRKLNKDYYLYLRGGKK
jgi:hypothetical protein